MQDVIRAAAYSIEDFFTLGAFQPANVQRDFRWTPWHGDKLVSDIYVAAREAGYIPAEDTEDEAAPDEIDAPMGEEEDASPDDLSDIEFEEHPAVGYLFFGSIILNEEASGAYRIFDGFQRSTTLTIIAAILRDLISNAELKARLANCVAFDGGFRLRHPNRENTLATNVQTPGAASIRRTKRSAPESDAERRIFSIQTKLALSMSRYSEQELNGFALFLLERTSVTVTYISNQKLARHAFVATNMYGVPLRRDEVFKGELMSLASSPEISARIEDAWNQLRSTLGEDIEEFLIAMDLITRKKTQSQDPLGDLRAELKVRAENLELRSWLARVKRFAKAWAKLHEYLKHPTGGPIGNQIWRLGFIPWTDWKPLALIWTDMYLSALEKSRSHAGPTNRYKKRFAQLGRRCLVIALYDFGGQTRSDIFLRAARRTLRENYSEPFTDHGGSERPLDFSRKIRADVRARLSLPIEDQDVLRMLLRWREALLFGELAPGAIRGGTIEHVLPARPAMDSQWRIDFEDDEARYLRHRSLGNTCLVRYDTNQELGNHDYVDKLEILDRLRERQHFKSAAELDGFDQWTSDVIERRTKQIADQIWNDLAISDPAETEN